jgi:ABC-2 type transport system permease protein
MGKSRKEILLTNSRVIGAIAAKDIADAIRNKNVLTVILGMAMLVLTSRALPLLLTLDGSLRVVVYEAGDSGLVPALRGDESLALSRARSQAELERMLAEGTELAFGLVIPAGFGRASEEQLTAYTMHWSEPAEVQEQVALLEEKISAAAGRPVRIDVEEQALYPDLEAGGQLDMIIMSLIVAIIVISIVAVPLLILEEKESRTMDALLVSPVTAGQVVAGKALAGLVYGLVAAAVVLAFSASVVNSWGLALLAILAGVAFSVALGLLMGSLFDNQQNLYVWTGLVMILLLVPLFVASFGGTEMPKAVRAIADWMPAVALSDLLHASFAQAAALDLILPNLAVLLLGGLVFLWLTGRQVRRLEG